MIQTLLFMAAPVCMAFLLVGIHAYLGLHVLEREVVFVDISLSQVSAFGGALALIVLGEDHQPTAVVFSLGLCVLVSLVLSLLKKYETKVSQEALIGVTYAWVSGLLILVLDKSPHGAEHLKEAMVGNILFVTWRQVFETLTVYLVVGGVHWIYRDRFWAISKGTQKSFLWDFIFYVLFGIIITMSTQHAGVLVVFSILVIPAALAVRFATGIMTRLLISWVLGFLGIVIAFLLSYKFDWPVGAGIVTVLATGFFSIIFGTILRRLFFPSVL